MDDAILAAKQTLGDVVSAACTQARIAGVEGWEVGEIVHACWFFTPPVDTSQAIEQGD